LPIRLFEIDFGAGQGGDRVLEEQLDADPSWQVVFFVRLNLLRLLGLALETMPYSNSLLLFRLCAGLC
jgi:hypothetical protein